MFQAADLIFVHGTGLLAEGIRWAERSRGEGPSYANHVGGFVSPTMVVEAKWTVLDHAYADAVAAQSHQVWRCMALTEEQRAAVAACACQLVGRSYGTDKIALQLGDSLLGKITGEDVDLFRRLDESDARPICSMLWALAYARALGIRFGIDPRIAQPDDMHDWVLAHGEWEKIYEVRQ